MKGFGWFALISLSWLLMSLEEDRGPDFVLPVDTTKVKRAIEAPSYTNRRYFVGTLREGWQNPRLEFAMPSGEKVRAIGAGQVLKSEYATDLGYHVTIQHNDSITSTYAHLSKLSVEAGELVNKGRLVGLVGSSGLSAAPHLALYMRISDKLVKPCSLLPCEQLPTVE